MSRAPDGSPIPAILLSAHRHALVRRLVGGGVWVFIGRIAGIGLTLLSNVVLARWLSPGEFGQFLMVVSIIGFLSILARFGVDRVLVRFVSEGLGTQNATLVQRTLRVSFFTGLASTLCVAALAILILYFLRNVLELPALVLLWVGGSVPVFAISCLVAESFRGFHHLGYASLFQPHSGPITTLVFVVSLLFIVTMRPSLYLAVLCYIGSVACILPLGFALLARTIKRSLPKQEITKAGNSTSLSLSHMLSVCAPIAISDTFGFLALNAGLWIAVVWCSQDDVALYGAARLLAMSVLLPLNLINMTVISSIPELYTQGNLAKLQRMLQISATLAAIPTALCVLLFVIAPALLLEAVFGTFYRDAALILVILSLAQLVSALTGSCFNTLLLTGRQNVIAALNVLSVVIILVLGPILGRAYGAVGIAVVSASVIALINIAAWVVAKIHVGVWTHATFRLTR